MAEGTVIGRRALALTRGSLPVAVLQEGLEIWNKVMANFIVPLMQGP